MESLAFGSRNPGCGELRQRIVFFYSLRVWGLLLRLGLIHGDVAGQTHEFYAERLI